MKKLLIGIAVASVIGLAPTLAPITAEASVVHKLRGPTVEITSPGRGATLAPGEGIPGDGTLNGSGFALNIEVQTHDAVGVSVNEGLNIRHTAALGGPNPDFPGLDVTLDKNLTTPTGDIIAAGTNLAPLFNVAGADDTPGPGMTIWAGWHVLESLAPGTRNVTITAAVRDDAGRVGMTREYFKVRNAVSASGQTLTPPPGALSGAGVDTRGPVVSIEAPQTPTSVALGTLPQPTLINGTLMFLQVDAADFAHHGIGVSVNGPGTGVIADPTQIGIDGPNRNYPGLDVTFDVALRQPNGNLVPAGQNLAPLFNIAGNEVVGRVGMNPGRRQTAVRTVADWVVGGSLVLPPGQDTVTITARVTDDANRTGSTSITVGVSPATSGQDLTPAP